MNENGFQKKQLLLAALSAAAFLVLAFLCFRLGRGGIPLLACLIIHTAALLLLCRDALFPPEPEEWEEEPFYAEPSLPESPAEKEDAWDIENDPFRHIYAEIRETLVDSPSRAVQPEELPAPIPEEAFSLTEAEELDSSPDAEPLLPVVHAFLAEPKASVEMDLIAAAHDAIESLSAFADAQKIKLHLTSACETLMMRADPESIRILFRNIIDNSIKYMGRPGHMIITISLLGDDIFIILKDTGNGLPEEETLHVFELNFQGSNRVSGNGLGLTQTKMIVEAFGGTIYAKSSPGNGMAIYIQLPVSGKS